MQRTKPKVFRVQQRSPRPPWLPWRLDYIPVANLEELQQRLDYTFRDEGLLRLSLTHPSVAHESADFVPHNQRMEFLGDAVLGLVLTHELYEKFGNLSEGPLTKARAQLVN